MVKNKNIEIIDDTSIVFEDQTYWKLNGKWETAFRNSPNSVALSLWTAKDKDLIKTLDGLLEEKIIKAKRRSGASFSECRKYRYALWRIWDESKPLAMFIGLNPSTANETANDATIERVKSIVENWNYGGFYMMNCFPLVSTKPEILNEFYDTSFHDVEDIQNMRWLLEVSKKCSEIIFAWGNFKVVENRAKSIIGYFKNAKALHINKNGSPKHPLYCKKDTKPVKFNNSVVVN